jgi:periplasmic divalent cation tolerance protein
MTENPPKTRNYGVVLVTTSSSAEAEVIAVALIESQMAACVSIFPIQSTYRWQGAITKESEWQLLIKTDLSCLRELENQIKRLHSYEVPEIIALPIVSGSMSYLAWLGNSLSTKNILSPLK